MKRKISIVALLCLLILVLTGCGAFSSGEASTAPPKTFTKDGFTITLTEDFEESEVETQTAVYQSQNSVVLALKEDASQFDGDLTLTQYAELVLSNNDLSSPIEEKEGFTCFTYEKKSGFTTYAYLAIVQKSEDAYWLIQFGCNARHFDTQMNAFLEWAKTIEI